MMPAAQTEGNAACIRSYCRRSVVWSVRGSYRFAGFEYTTPGSYELTQILGCVAYALLIVYLIWDSKRARKL